MSDCTLWFGDCLRVMADASVVEPASVDLIYLDPPFNSKRDYNIVHDSGTQETMFADTWSWGDTQEAGLTYLQRQDAQVSRKVDALLSLLNDKRALQAYLAFMAPRLMACRNALKPTGSIYLHCDPNASHYLKIMMDMLFGINAFSNEISWRSSVGSRNDASRYGRGHDTILFYAPADAHFTPQLLPMTPETQDSWYRYTDEEGRRYNVDNITGPGGRGYEYEFLGETRVWRYPPDRMNELLEEGRIVHESTVPGSKRKVAGLRRCLDESTGRVPTDFWDDVPPIGRRSKERLPYPTQKPIALLNRVIESSSQPGDLVMDPFCGCGTSAEASISLGRRFIGIDVAPKAVELMRWRVRERCGIEPIVHGLPYDYDSAVSLARPQRSDIYRATRDFERWAVERIPGAQSNLKQTSDRGLDGTARVDLPGVSARNRPTIGFQVKSGTRVGRPDADAFAGALESERCVAGLLIVLERSRARRIRRAIGRQDTVTLGAWTGPRVVVWSIEEHFEGSEPDLPLIVGREETQALMSAREWQPKMPR